MATSKYHFNISLSVLNHLGRNLYRNFITILGEAISNSWDADAEHIQITLDKDNKRLVITDNGEGMSSSDFENKFLLVGYSKRNAGDKERRSSKGRRYIGRKGIGKLALLSCAQKISIYTKKEGEELTGGTIDNDALDEILNSRERAQADSFTAKNYELTDLSPQNIQTYEKELTDGHGTVIVFEELNAKVSSNIPYLRTQIALYFRFSLIDPKFQISLNGDIISDKDLHKLTKRTQFVWTNRLKEDSFLDSLEPLEQNEIDTSEEDADIKFSFFIASVNKPSDLNIHGTGEKIGIDLYVNGRLRETNIMRRRMGFSTQILSSYLYGQVHCDFLDDEGLDRFTSSREGVIEGDEEYAKVLDQLEKILLDIRYEWDVLRKKHRLAGPPPDDNASYSIRKAQHAFNLFETILEEISGNDAKATLDRLRKAVLTPGENDIEANITEYAQMFIIENYLRFKINPSDLTSQNKQNISDQEECDAASMEEAGLHIPVRHEMHGLERLTLRALAKLLELDIAVKRYIPIRNAVAHTGKLTREARQESQASYTNIIQGIRNLDEDS